MLVLHTQNEQKRWRRRFIYDPRWNATDGFQQLVKDRWEKPFCGSRSVQVVSKLHWVRKGILNWRRRDWRNSRARIETLRRDLCMPYQESNFDRARVQVLESELKTALHEEEAYWKLK
ncbi:unnamed protein product [Prunus brigantina]